MLPARTIPLQTTNKSEQDALSITASKLFHNYRNPQEMKGTRHFHNSCTEGKFNSLLLQMSIMQAQIILKEDFKSVHSGNDAIIRVNLFSKQ